MGWEVSARELVGVDAKRRSTTRVEKDKSSP